MGESFAPILKHIINHDSFKQPINAARVAYMLLQAQRRSVSDKEAEIRRCEETIKTAFTLTLVLLERVEHVTLTEKTRNS